MTIERPEHARCRSMATGISLYAQVIIGLCLFLTEYTGTPGWMAILLTGPVTFLCAWLARRTPVCKGAVSRALVGLIAWMDEVIVFYVLCGLCKALLPDLNAWLLSAVLCALSWFSSVGKERALMLASRPIIPLILVPIAYNACAAVPNMDLGNLFPLLGAGMPRLLGGAVWMLGSTVPACLIFLTPAANAPARPSLLPPVLGLLFGAITAFLYALLLPYPALQRPAALSEKLTLLTQLSSPTAGWSLLIGAQLFLLFYSLTLNLSRAGEMICALGNKKGKPQLLTAALLLPSLIIGACMTEQVNATLLMLSPLRFVLALGLLIGLNLKKAPPKEVPSPA
ncbi:MAG: hypothetical protein IJ189_08305 [Clostridia bacterium]|nr:hypothetical protein [Clostridia bacterium]